MVAAKAEKVAAKAAERKRAGSNPSKENRRVACDCRQLSFFFRYAFMTILGDSTLISAQSKKKERQPCGRHSFCYTKILFICRNVVVKFSKSGVKIF